MTEPTSDELEHRGRRLVSVLSFSDAAPFAAEREERGLDEPLRRFDELLAR